MRLSCLLSLLLALLLLLAGCWNKMELEEGAYVLAVGIDKGESSPYAITVVIAKPSALASEKGGGSEEAPVVTTTVEAPSLASARAVLHGYIGRQVLFHHAQAFFVHEQLARSQGLPFLDELLRFRQIRETAFLVVTREPAADFMKGLKPELEKDPMRYMEQLTYHSRTTGTLPAASQIRAVASVLNVGYAQPVTYYAARADEGSPMKKDSPDPGVHYSAGDLPRRGGTPVEMIGAAAFRNSRMVGVLNGEETRALLMLQNRFHSAYVAFRDPRRANQYVTVHLSRGRPTRIVLERLGERPAIRVEVILEAEVAAMPSGIDYSEPGAQEELERAIASQLEETLRALIAKTQQWQVDVVGFGRHAIPRFPTVQAWEAYNWPQRYPHTEIRASVRVNLRRYGLTLSPTRASEEGAEE